MSFISVVGNQVVTKEEVIRSQDIQYKNIPIFGTDGIMIDSGISITTLLPSTATEGLYVNSANTNDGDGSVTNPFQTLDACISYIIDNGFANLNLTISVTGSFNTSINLHTGNSFFFEPGSSVTYNGTSNLFDDSSYVGNLTISGYGNFTVTNSSARFMSFNNMTLVDIDFETITCAGDGFVFGDNNGGNVTIRGKTITTQGGSIACNSTSYTQGGVGIFTGNVSSYSATKPCLYYAYPRHHGVTGSTLYNDQFNKTVQIKLNSSEFNAIGFTNCTIQNNAFAFGDTGMCVSLENDMYYGSSIQFNNCLFNDNNTNNNLSYDPTRRCIVSNNSVNMAITNCIAYSDIGGTGNITFVSNYLGLNLINSTRTIDITGLTTLNLSGYYAVNTFILTSSNTSENISAITGTPITHDIKLVVTGNLMLKLTGTAIGSANSSSITLPTAASSITLNGNNEEWVQLRNSQYGTGNRISNTVSLSYNRTVDTYTITGNGVSGTSGAGYVLTHNKNSYDVVIQLMDYTYTNYSSTNYTAQRTSLNTVTITFNLPPANGVIYYVMLN